MALSSICFCYLVAICGPRSFTSYPTSRALLAQEHLVVVAVATSLLELLRRPILICIVLVSIQVADIMLVVHVGGILFGLVVSTLAVVSVHAWDEFRAMICTLGRRQYTPLVSASLSTSPPTNPMRSSLAKAWFTVLPVALLARRGPHA